MKGICFTEPLFHQVVCGEKEKGLIRRLLKGIFRIYSDNYYIYQNGYTRESYHTQKQACAALIDSISGKGAWESNPFVRVYDFKLTTK